MRAAPAAGHRRPHVLRPWHLRVAARHRPPQPGTGVRAARRRTARGGHGLLTLPPGFRAVAGQPCPRPPGRDQPAADTGPGHRPDRRPDHRRRRGPDLRAVTGPARLRPGLRANAARHHRPGHATGARGRLADRGTGHRTSHRQGARRRHARPGRDGQGAGGRPGRDPDPHRRGLRRPGQPRWRHPGGGRAARRRMARRDRRRSGRPGPPGLRRAQPGGHHPRWRPGYLQHPRPGLAAGRDPAAPHHRAGHRPARGLLLACRQRGRRHLRRREHGEHGGDPARRAGAAMAG